MYMCMYIYIYKTTISRGNIYKRKNTRLGGTVFGFMI